MIFELVDLAVVLLLIGVLYFAFERNIYLQTLFVILAVGLTLLF